MKKIRRIITEYPCVCAGGDAITLYEQSRLKETGIIAVETFVKSQRKGELT